MAPSDYSWNKRWAYGHSPYNGFDRPDAGAHSVYTGFEDKGCLLPNKTF